MPKLPSRPVIYEINAVVFLAALSQNTNKRLTLTDVPGAEWDRLATLGVDAVWLMGVWQRSPISISLSKGTPEFKKVLPDVTDADIAGSAYSVQNFVVADELGGPEALAAVRGQLADRGIGLILDYVPNHVAIDHPWALHHPEYFIQGDHEDLRRHPHAFVATGGGVLANGKDPHYAPWTDVVQVNAFSPEFRGAALRTLRSIADQCDGVRCDMAMLMSSDIFAHTWKERAGKPPKTEFWEDIIPAIKISHPDFSFIAEVYWKLEKVMLRQGFDFSYDKELYDRILEDDAPAVHRRLAATREIQDHLVRFIENHDEARVARQLSAPRAKAAAVLLATLPSARLWHDGQLEGYRVKLPVHLRRQPKEAPDSRLRNWHARLLSAVATSGLHGGNWRLLECENHDGQRSRQLLAWCWQSSKGRYVAIINYSGSKSSGQILLPWANAMQTRDVLRTSLKCPQSDTSGTLKIELPPWDYYLLHCSPISS
jgi:glycosidase